MRLRALVFLVALCAMAGVVSAPCRAQMPGYNGWKSSISVWQRMDACKRQAFMKFPDYTRQGEAKRARSVRMCLEAQNLPPAAPPAPRPETEGSGSSRR